MTNDRHPKWVRVEPGTVIPAGQPYRVETPRYAQRASEFVDYADFIAVSNTFVDSSWKPPHPCNAPLNIRGEGFNCDKGWGHALPHGNTKAGAIWDGEQPPTGSPEPEPDPEPPLVLPTENTYCIVAVHRSRGGLKYRLTKGRHVGEYFAGYPLDNVVQVIPLTDEQVARIEAAR